MFNLHVKISTLFKRLMQVLCLLSLFYSNSIAQSQSSLRSEPVSVASQDETQKNMSAMIIEIEKWFYKNQKINKKDLTIRPLDPRILIGSCSKPLTIDLPFASRETVRVRCAEPIWQLYVQVALNNPSPVPAPKSTGPGLAESQTPNGLTAQSVRTVVVSKVFLKRGSVIQPEWLETVQVPVGPVDTSWLGTVVDAQQSELVRDVPAGQPIKSSDIRKAVLVRQGQTVLLSVGDKMGFQITVRAEALQDGRLGEQVKLKNAESGRQISGVVTGPNTAKGL
jgi:flagella basal body P-ring formation protein FlgA